MIDEFLSRSLLGEREAFSDEVFEGGYSISVVQTCEGTKVKVKVGKDVDVNAIQRRLQQQYPNAQIEIEGGKTEPLIKELSTKTIRKDEEKEQDKNKDE